MHTGERSATTEGFWHDGGFYGSDEQFGAILVPFAEGGLDAGEAVVFGYDERKHALLRAWLPDDPAVTYVAAANAYTRPARALVEWGAIARGQLALGYPRVRLAGEVPPGTATSFAGWDRYEAAIDRAWSPLAVWARCLYDTRLTPSDVVERVTRLHHTLVDGTETVGAHAHGQGTSAHAGFSALTSVADCMPAELDPMERDEPVVELRDPTPAGAREIVGALAVRRVGQGLTDDLRLATSEVVTNAILHGRGPVLVSMWAAPGKVAVHVRDRGSGPPDPLVGILPPTDLGRGASRGLWITHQLDLDVAFVSDPSGFTVRLFASGRA